MTLSYYIKYLVKCGTYPLFDNKVDLSTNFGEQFSLGTFEDNA